MTPKKQLIEEICQQSCYMQDSGLVCNVKAALKRLSHSDVSALHLLIKLKVEDAKTSVHNEIAGRRLLKEVKDAK